MMKLSRASGWVVVGASIAASSCFYDSRWGEPKRAQAAAAQHATPKALRPTDAPAGPATPLRVMRVRAHATARYAAEVVDWQRQLSSLVDAAAEVLGPTLGIRLEVVEASLWPAHADEQDLAELLAELQVADPGEGADWVIGLAGSVPRAEMSFQELGVSHRPGKHLVMRAMSNAHEYEMIRKELSELDEGERGKLYDARKRHKATTVLLHELAHSLGLPHQRGTSEIMSPRYSIQAERFSDAATEWMRAALKLRAQSAPAGEPTLEEVELSILERTPEEWVATERDALISRLRAALAARALAKNGPPAGRPAMSSTATVSAAPASSASGSSASGNSAGAGEGGAGRKGLSAADQALFSQAEADEKNGKPMEAYNRAKPLYAKYPDVAAVQDLRCRLVMKLDATWETVEAECAPMMRLTGVPAKKK